MSKCATTRSPSLADAWLTRSVRVVDAHGLHTRPAAALVAVARAFDAEIHIAANGRSADGKSIVSILSLAAAHGTPLELRARGTDAAAALECLAQTISAGFDG